MGILTWLIGGGIITALIMWWISLVEFF